MIALDDNEITTLLMMMALDSEGYQPRQIAVMGSANDIEITDSGSGEPLDAGTVRRIYAQARDRDYFCEGCGDVKPIAAWTPESHVVNLCAGCFRRETTGKDPR